MAFQTKQKISKNSRTLRAGLLAFLMLCLLLSCPLKREIKQAFSKHAPVENSHASQSQARSAAFSFDQAGIAENCTAGVFLLLADAMGNPLLQHVEISSPYLLLATSLAFIYAFLLYLKGKGSHPAFSGNVLANDIPLFLLLRKILI